MEVIRQGERGRHQLLQEDQLLLLLEDQLLLLQEDQSWRTNMNSREGEDVFSIEVCTPSLHALGTTLDGSWVSAFAIFRLVLVTAMWIHDGESQCFVHDKK